MPVAKEKRDYRKEYMNELKRNQKTFSVKVDGDFLAVIDAKIALEPLTEDGKKVTRNSLINKWLMMYAMGELH